MGVTDDILRTLRAGPREVVRDHLALGEQESRAFAFLMLGCAIVFVAQWPQLTLRSRSEGIELDRLVVYALLGWLMAWPLAFYFLAWLTHGASRLMGGRGTPFGARLALFWSWLAASPLALLGGAAGGLSGSQAANNLLAIVWVGVFAAFWSAAQREAATGPRGHVA